MQRKKVNISQFALSIILAIAIASILVAIAVTISATANTSMPVLTGVSGMANQTLYNVYSSAYNGLSFETIIPVVLIAVVVIALIIGAFSLFRASGAAE